MKEEILKGGYLASAVRVGDTVRRQTGPWTASVHALLLHLENVGFEGAPRVQGVDDLGREVLTFIPGETLGTPPWPPWVWDDNVLRHTSVLLRRYHQAVASFRPSKDSVWRFTTGAPGPGEVICHNDVGPQNLVFREKRPVALVDWDWAEPAIPEWDLAHAAWLGVPLISPDSCERLALRGASAEWQATRLGLLASAYGLTGELDLVKVVIARVQTSIARVRRSQESQDHAVANLKPFIPEMTSTLDYLGRHHSMFSDALS
jgi:hypothetical protein